VIPYVILDHSLLAGNSLGAEDTPSEIRSETEVPARPEERSQFRRLLAKLQIHGILCRTTRGDLDMQKGMSDLNLFSTLSIDIEESIQKTENIIAPVRDLVTDPEKFRSMAEMLCLFQVLDNPLCVLGKELQTDLADLKSLFQGHEKIANLFDAILRTSVVVDIEQDNILLSGSPHAISKLHLAGNPAALRLKGTSIHELVKHLQPLLHAYQAVVLIDTAIRENEINKIEMFITEANKLKRNLADSGTGEGLKWFLYFKQQHECATANKKKYYEGELIDHNRSKQRYRIPRSENLSHMWHDRHLVFMKSLGDYTNGVKVVFSSPFSQIFRGKLNDKLRQGTAMSVEVHETGSVKSGFEDVGDLLRVLSRKVDNKLKACDEI